MAGMQGAGAAASVIANMGCSVSPIAVSRACQRHGHPDLSANRAPVGSPTSSACRSPPSPFRHHAGISGHPPAQAGRVSACPPADHSGSGAGQDCDPEAAAGQARHPSGEGERRCIGCASTAATVACRPPPADRLTAAGLPLQGPCCHDGLSARLIERARFDFAFMSGFCTAAARLGLPDTGLMSYAEMVDTGRNCHEATSRLPSACGGGLRLHCRGSAAGVCATLRGLSLSTDHLRSKHAPRVGCRTLPGTPA